MGTKVEREEFPETSRQSIMLANQAWMEQQENGYVSVICPKCQEHPKITITSNGERMMIKCKCGYVRNAEIYF